MPAQCHRGLARLPCQLDQFENHFARQVLSHSFAMMANLTSIIHTGVPARYPKLQIVFTEAGIAWVPYMMWRMDKYHKSTAAWCRSWSNARATTCGSRCGLPPSRSRSRTTPSDLVDTIDQIGGPERILFASDWPHHDFDHPRAILKLPMAAEVKRKIMGENALAAVSASRRPRESCRKGEGHG